MKTLDDQMPSGYFEGLPNRTLARLEDSSMQTTGTSSGDVSTSTGQPPQLKQRDEDSGLHDIRELASSQRMRLSSRRVGSTSPPVDEDILASTSGSWKAVALPEPARMISLPELSELPAVIETKSEPKETKKDRKSRKSGELAAAQAAVLPSQSAPALPVAAKADAPVDATLRLDEPVAKPAAVAPIIPMQIGSRIAAPKKSNKGLVLGVLGAGLAAAAGIVVYVQTKGDATKQAASTMASDTAPARQNLGEGVAGAPAEKARASAPTAQAIATDDLDKKADEPAGTASGPADAAIVAPDPAPAKAPPRKGKVDTKPDGKKQGKQIIEVPGPDPKTEKPTKKPEVPVTKGDKPKDGEPDFDQLLKEAGEEKPKEIKPKLERTALSAGDFKKGMSAVQGRAQKCYDGTQGTASVKLTIAPSGQVTKVVVSGQFAGTSVAACIEAAVKGASFPAWDGGPQSMGYSYLLSE
jgi:hypothetical protein